MVSSEDHYALVERVTKTELYLSTDTEEQTCVSTMIKQLKETVYKQ